MKRKRHTPDQIIALLRDAEADLAAGLNVEQVCKKLGVSQQTYFRWKSQYGGAKAASMKRLKELEAENKRLKKAVADLTLEKQILKEVAQGVAWQPNLRNACVSQESNPGAATISRETRAAHAGVLGTLLVQHGPASPQHPAL